MALAICCAFFKWVSQYFIFLQVTFQDLNRSSQVLYCALEQINRLLLAHPALGEQAPPPSPTRRRNDLTEDNDTAVAVVPAEGRLSELKPEFSSGLLPDCVPAARGQATPAATLAAAAEVPDLISDCDRRDRAELVIAKDGEATVVAVEMSKSQEKNDQSALFDSHDKVPDFATAHAHGNSPLPEANQLEDKGGWAQCGGRLAHMLRGHNKAGLPKDPREEQEPKDGSDNSIQSFLGDVGVVLAVAGALLCVGKITRAFC